MKPIYHCQDCLHIVSCFVSNCNYLDGREGEIWLIRGYSCSYLAIISATMIAPFEGGMFRRIVSRSLALYLGMCQVIHILHIVCYYSRDNVAKFLTMWVTCSNVVGNHVTHVNFQIHLASNIEMSLSTLFNQKFRNYLCLS